MELEALRVRQRRLSGNPRHRAPPHAVSYKRCPDDTVAMTTGPLIPQMHEPKNLFTPFILQEAEDLNVAKCT